MNAPAAAPASGSDGNVLRRNRLSWWSLGGIALALFVGALMTLPAGPGGNAGSAATLRGGPVALASPTSTGASNWSAVQVAFLVETTSYDGVYDSTAGDTGYDVCAQSSSTPAVCEESNGVPVLASRAGQVAQAIAAAHPGTNVSFAMGDFFATLDNFDDGDGYAFHVDVANFTGGATFQSAVNSSLRTKVLGAGYVYSDSDLSDNQLHSPAITALYGALGTSGFHWSSAAHHVVVLVSSTAPRAPGYAVNYSVSASDYSTFCGHSCMSPTCEPSWNFTGGISSPKCEGWTSSQTSNVNDSIAWLAQNGTICAGSLGGNCTVDTISLYNGVTDPASKQWPAGRHGGGPNGAVSKMDSSTILNASCAMASATGGSWDGPNFFTCPNGQAGTLAFSGIGKSSAANTSNPTLVSALTNVSFGFAPVSPEFNHRGDLLITDQFNNRVIEVNPHTDKIVWSFGSGNATLCNPGPGAVIAPNDAERLAHGLTLIAGTGTSSCPDNRVLVVNGAGHIVWQYGQAGVTGSGRNQLNVPVFAVQLPNHDILVVDQGNNRVIEVSLAKHVVWSYGPTSGPGMLNAPNSAELLANGDVLIADENNNRVIEVDHNGSIVWSYSHGLSVVAFASRLANGNTLIADSGHNRIVEINSSGSVVFQYRTNLGPGSNANPNPTSAVRLKDGNLLIADQFNDRVIVVNGAKHVVFQYGTTNVVGSGFDQLNAPYSVVEIGDYTGVTAPPANFR